MPSSMLLLGGAGFVGSYVERAAAAAGLDVVTASRAGGGKGLVCDLLDPASIEHCLAEAEPDLIVNAAGAASVGRSWERPAETFAANATGVVNLLQAVAARAPDAHVTCLSSADVYGVRDAADLPLREDLAARPVTPYGSSKAAMETICGQYGRGRGLRIAVARLFNLVGPGQSERFALPGFARRVAAAEHAGEVEVELALGNAGAVRDFVDAAEGAGALLGICSHELEGTYNLCSGRGTSIAALVAELGELARVTVRVREDPELARPADPPALVGDPQRLRERTGFAASVPLRQSLAGLLDDWRARLSA